MDRDDLASRIYQISHITGDFTLRSGQTSTEYFDKYLFEADPLILRSIAESMVPLVPPGTELLAGLEMGGIPIVSILSQLTGLNSLFVRKTAKTYGTCKLAEGPDFNGKRVLVIEDVVSSGGQIVLSSADLRERGALVSHALCAIDRESGGLQNLADAGIDLHSVFKAGELSPGHS